jgi:HEAT repeat protein
MALRVGDDDPSAWHRSGAGDERMTVALLGLLAPVVALFLLVAVVARKAGRDRDELRSRRRRSALATMPAADLSALISASLKGRAWEQTDLLLTLRRADETTRARMVASADPVVAGRALLASGGHRNPVVRGRMLLIASWLAHPAAVQAAARLLADRDPDVRLAACEALDLIRSPAAAEILIAALYDGIVPTARLVERLGSSWAVASLLDAVSDAPAGAPRAACLRALGLAGEAGAVSAVVPHLMSPDLEERIAAARTLGQLGDPGCCDELLVAFGDERWEVRAQVATALGELGDGAAVDGLVCAVADHAWWVRANAARSLARLGPAGVAGLRSVAAGSDGYAAERADEELHLLEARAR